MQPDLQHGVKAKSELVLSVGPQLYPELRNVNAIVGMFRVCATEARLPFRAVVMHSRKKPPQARRQ